MKKLVEQIAQWHHDRNLIEGATDKAQYIKLIQEYGELSGNLFDGKDIRDDVGDMMVVLINITTRNKINFIECATSALNTSLLDLTNTKRALLLTQQLGFLGDAMCKNKDLVLVITDTLAILLSIMERSSHSIDECLEVAYNDIKDRKGRMVDGIFIKQGDF